jgi:hypothetical protein
MVHAYRLVLLSHPSAPDQPWEWQPPAMQLSLSRLNHWLPRIQAHPEVVQGTTEFHHQIADACFP